MSTAGDGPTLKGQLHPANPLLNNVCLTGVAKPLPQDSLVNLLGTGARYEGIGGPDGEEGEEDEGEPWEGSITEEMEEEEDAAANEGAVVDLSLYDDDVINTDTMCPQAN